MTLSLNKTQRINLHGLLGSLRPNIGVIRQVWALMDRVKLSEPEERSINLQRKFVGLREEVTWDVATDTELKDFEISAQELGLVVEALSPAVTAPADPGTRAWLEPLLDWMTSASNPTA